MIEIPYTKLHKESLIPTVSKELRVDNPGSDTWSGVLPSLIQPGEKHESDLLFLCLYELVILRGRLHTRILSYLV
jgi:hypothetical protein